MREPCHVLQLIASSHGGGAAHVLDLAAMLPQDQFRVTVAMPEDGGNVSPDQIRTAGATFTAVSINAGFRWRELLKIRKLLQEEGFDLIHVHGARAGAYGRLAALTSHRRPYLLFSIHGFATPYYSRWKKAAYLTIERFLQRVTDKTICVAQAEADLFLQYNLTTSAKIEVINPGTDLERFQTATQSDHALRKSLKLTDDPIILTICRLHIPRDFETLLTAVQLTRQTFPNIQLLIVGDGPLRTTIASQIAAKQLTKNVSLLGFRQDIPDLLQLAHLFTLTSTGWEGFPISTLEAQAMGCPVVVTDAGGSAEAVLHNQTGLVVPKKDAHALAHAFCQLLADEPFRKRLGEQGKKRAQQFFSRGEMVRKITAVYAKGCDSSIK